MFVPLVASLGISAVQLFLILVSLFSVFSVFSVAEVFF
jgi:hypothetical protein